MLEQRLERKKSQKRQRKRQKPFDQFGNIKVSNFSRENSNRYLFRLSPLENKHLEGMEKKGKNRLKEHYIQFPQRLNRDESGQYWKSLNSIISTVNSRYDEHSSHKLPNHSTQHYDLFSGRPTDAKNEGTSLTLLLMFLHNHSIGLMNSSGNNSPLQKFYTSWKILHEEIR